MKRVSPATEYDIRFILAHLSHQNDAERQRIGFDIAAAGAHLTNLLVNGYSEIAEVGGSTVAAFGMSERDGYNDTWFVATDEFFAMGVAGIRYARARVKYLRERFRLPLRSVSMSPLPEAPRWFRALGFVELDRPHIDAPRVFVYK